MVFLLALALWAVLFFLVLVFNHGAHLNDQEFEDHGRERVGQPEDAFPPEVHALRRERGVPFPTWYSGPLYPTDDGQEAQAAFDQWAAERDERVRRAEFRHATRFGKSA